MEAFCLPECIVGGAFVAAAGRRNRARRRHGNGEGNYGDVLGADDDEKQLVEHGLLVPAILFIILLPPTRWLLSVRLSKTIITSTATFIIGLSSPYTMGVVVAIKVALWPSCD